MIFRRFKDSDIPSCIKIWNLSFTGDEFFSQVFFSEIIGFTDAYVCEYESVTAGFICVFKFVADCGLKQMDCNYIYGVCVHPDFRNRGIMRKMLNSVMKPYDGMFFLIPQVTGVYEKFGFRYVNCFKTTFHDNPKNNFNECYDAKHLDKIYNIYRRQFGFSLRRTLDWWNIIVKILVNDGYKIIANNGAYAIIKDEEMLEFAYVSDEYKNALPVGRAVLKYPEIMISGNFDYKDYYIALMLEWE